MTTKIAARLPADSLRALLDDLDRELGEPSADNYAWVEKALGLDTVAARPTRPA